MSKLDALEEEKRTGTGSFTLNGYDLPFTT
jgi:hypothetical protein